MASIGPDKSLLENWSTATSDFDGVVTKTQFDAVVAALGKDIDDVEWSSAQLILARASKGDATATKQSDSAYTAANFFKTHAGAVGAGTSGQG